MGMTAEGLAIACCGVNAEAPKTPTPTQAAAANIEMTFLT
jgi:hypothetical protein